MVGILPLPCCIACGRGLLPRCTADQIFQEREAWKPFLGNGSRRAAVLAQAVVDAKDVEEVHFAESSLWSSLYRASQYPFAPEWSSSY